MNRQDQFSCTSLLQQPFQLRLKSLPELRPQWLIGVPDQQSQPHAGPRQPGQHLSHCSCPTEQFQGILPAWSRVQSLQLAASSAAHANGVMSVAEAAVRCTQTCTRFEDLERLDTCLADEDFWLWQHSCTVRHQILWYAYPVRVPDGYGRGTRTLESILKRALGRHP